MHTEANAPRWRRWSTCCRFRPFCAARPICCLPPAKTGAAINIKKGQFLAPWDMANVADKFASTGNDRILLTERRHLPSATTTLVADMRALPQMAQTGYPGGIHWTPPIPVQTPRGGRGGSSSGQREITAPVMANAAVSLGIPGCSSKPTRESGQLPPADGPNIDPAGADGGPGRQPDGLLDRLGQGRPDPGLRPRGRPALEHAMAGTQRRPESTQAEFAIQSLGETH